MYINLLHIFFCLNNATKEVVITYKGAGLWEAGLCGIILPGSYYFMHHPEGRSNFCLNKIGGGG